MISEWQNKWALVTGASAGIGVALAEELAAGGTHLLLTARRLDRLEKLAADLRKKYGIQTQVFATDLAELEAPEKIFEHTKEKGLAIDLLINNAGFGQYGELHKVEKQRLVDMVEVNCTAVVHLTRLFLPDMVARRAGDILIVASTAASLLSPIHQCAASPLCRNGVLGRDDEQLLGGLPATRRMPSPKPCRTSVRIADDPG